MEGSINERIKFLITQLGMSARAFSHAIEVSESTTRNYLDKGSKPGTDYIERIANHFGNVNLVWLITGKGEALTGETPINNNTNISGGTNSVATGRHGTVTNNHYSLDACMRERDDYKSQLEKAQLENQSLRDQLTRADALVAAKDEMLDLLRVKFNRPN